MSEANVWSFVLAGLGISGLLLAGSKRKVGWLVGFAIQPLWILFAIRTEQYGFVLNALAYAAVYGRNWWAWRKDEMCRARSGEARAARVETARIRADRSQA